MRPNLNKAKVLKDTITDRFIKELEDAAVSFLSTARKIQLTQAKHDLIIKIHRKHFCSTFNHLTVVIIELLVVKVYLTYFHTTLLLV